MWVKGGVLPLLNKGFSAGEWRVHSGSVDLTVTHCPLWPSSVSALVDTDPSLPPMVRWTDTWCNG